MRRAATDWSLIGILVLIAGLGAGVGVLAAQEDGYPPELTQAMEWRNIGPFRGGRSVAAAGVVSDPMTYYFGATGGGVRR